MKVVAISDTHGLHHQLEIPEGDLLIHSGDLSYEGTEVEIQDFLDWFSALPHPQKVFIAGNHDFYLETASEAELEKIIPSNIHYLNDQLLEIEGIRIWGSPITPIPGRRWAFNRERGADIQPHWDLIPENLDLLMVHGPAYGIFDTTLSEKVVGCENLRETLFLRKPKHFIFGHIHEARGIQTLEGIQCINASSVDRHRTELFPPIIFEL